MRAKLLAAFQKFLYQHAELQHAAEESDFLEMARYFGLRISKYDFWDDTEMWYPLGTTLGYLRSFLKDGRPNIIKFDEAKVREFTGDNEEEFRRVIHEQSVFEILELWRQLALLPRMYEELCREWLLPTALGVQTR